MKKPENSIGINALLNAIKTGLSIIFPLVTYPYAFRVLKAANLGKVDYASSIVGYFALIAALGYSTYAVREGAKIRDDKEKISDFASQIFSMNLITTVLSYVLLLLCALGIPKLEGYELLIFVTSISILLKTLSMDWVNSIFEDYLYITIRSIIAQLIIVGLLFILVRNQQDYVMYALLSVIANTVVCIMNLIYIRRYVRIRFTLKWKLHDHFRPVMLLFANFVATTIYVNSDVTMLGWVYGDIEVGLYTAAVKIYTVVKNMLAAVYTVAIPRISYYLGQNQKEKVKSLYSDMVSEVILILVPASAGIVAIAKEIIIFMCGRDYLESVSTLQILGISLIGAILGGLVTYCINIPLGKERVNMEATSLSAFINIGLNIFMIPLYKQNGAAVTTLISEFFVFFYCIYRNREIKEYVDTRKIIRNSIQALAGVIDVFLVTFTFHYFTSNIGVNIIGIILCSVVLYLVELILVKNEFLIQVLVKIRGKYGK